MRGRPLRRSLVLWAGVFMIAFLGWGWWQSWHRVTNLWAGDWRYDCANGGLLVGWSSGHSWSITFRSTVQEYPVMEYTMRDVLWPQGYRGRNMEPGAFISSKRDQEGELPFAARIELYVVNQLTDAWIAYFPFPLLLLLTFLVWVLALIWRARRIRNIERASAAEA